jgi:probable O-glycosylation ligase (exosortase A-associated)
VAYRGLIPIAWQSDLNQRLAWFLALLVVSVGAGLATLRSDEPVAIAAVLAITPILVAILAMVHRLFLGVALYLLCEYLQPGFRFHALAPLHPTFAIALGLTIAYVLNLLVRRVSLNVQNWQPKAYLIFLLIVGASAYSAISVPRVFWAAVDILKTLSIFFIFIQIVDSVERLRRLVWIYIMVHFLLGLIGIAMFATFAGRRFGDVGGGFLGDENDSAMALLVMLPYVYFLMQIVRGRAVKLFLAVAMAVGSSAVLFSFSRGAFLGFIATIVYLWIKSSRKVTAAIGLAALLALFLTLMPGEYWERIESISAYQTEGSAQGRIDAWKGAIEMLVDHPLVGVGADNFNRTFGEHYNRNSARWTAAHSLYCQIIGELGLAGCIFVVWFLVRNFRDLARLRRRLAGQPRGSAAHQLYLLCLGIECGLVSYLITTFFLNSLFYPHLWHFSAMVAIATNCLRRLEREGGLTPPKPVLRPLSGQGGRDRLTSERPRRHAAGLAAEPSS